MSIRIALTRTTTDALTSVSSVAQSVTNTASILADLSGAAADHAQNYRERTKLSLTLSSDEMRLAAEDDAKRRITRRILSLREELKDDDFSKVYSAISFTGTSTCPDLAALFLPEEAPTPTEAPALSVETK